MKKKVKIKDIALYSKGTQINGDELLEEAKFDYLNGGIKPSGKWDNANCVANTVTISEGGNSCGYVNFMKNPFWCGAHCYFLYDIKIDSKYLYYALKSQQMRIMKLRSGACMPNIKKTDLGNFEFVCDDNSIEQKKITHILDKLECVIEQRKNEIQVFDELVKARFVEMFVDRGYPVKTIGDVIDRKITRVAKAFDKTDVIQYLDISSIDSSSKTVKKLTRYILAEAPSRAQYVLKYNDIMYSTVRPNLQNVAINTCSEENVVGSTGFCILRCIGVTVGYMWGVMNSISFTEAMTTQATGASYPAVTDKVVYSYKIPIPPKEEQIVYEQLVRQIAKSKIIDIGIVNFRNVS